MAAPQIVLAQIQQAGVLVTAYEEFLFGKVLSGSLHAEPALDALHTRTIVKHMEAATAIGTAFKEVENKDKTDPLQVVDTAERDAEEGTDSDPVIVSPAASPNPGKEDRRPNMGLDSWAGDIFTGDTAEVEKKLRQLWANCIPCDRPTLAGVDWGNVLEAFDLDWKARLLWLDELFDFLGRLDELIDLCDVLNFLNGMCVPDIIAMIGVLKFLLSNLANSLKDVSLGDLLNGLLGSMLQPYTNMLMAILRKWMGLIFQPIECIITSLITEMEKIPGTEGARHCLREVNKSNKRLVQSTLTGDTKKFQGGLTKLDDCTGLGLAYTSTLGSLGQKLLEGEALARDKLLLVEKFLKEILISDSQSSGFFLKITLQIKHLLRLLAFMGAFLIVAVNSENIDEYCNGKDLSEDAIESFVAALSPSMPGDVTVKRDADGALAGFIWGGPDLGSSSGGSDKNAQGQETQEVFSSFAKCTRGHQSLDLSRMQAWILEQEKEL